jgi:hypothetical protein
MPDDVEVLGPRLSEEGIAYQQGLLNNPTFCRDHPEHAAMIRATLDEAMVATGYQGPPTDPRTPAQRLHDQHFGLPTGDVVLPEALVTAMQRDASGQLPAPEAVAQHLERAGLSPREVMADAKFALERTGSKVPLESLNAFSLSQLALFGQHLRRHGESRPQ